MANEIGTSRRAFIAASAGAAAAGSVLPALESAAQSTAPLKIVDFHNHYIGTSWTLKSLAGMPAQARATWERIYGNLQSHASLLDSVESAGIAARVINTPTAFIEDVDGNIPPDAEQRINDQMAALVGQAVRTRHRRCLFR